MKSNYRGTVNFAACLRNLNRREEALVAAFESVTLHRDLAKNRPNDSNPGLATSLNNLVVYFSLLRRREEALEALQECLALHEVFAREQPAAFTSELALTLFNSGCYLSDESSNEKRAEGLAAFRRARTLYGTLAGQLPLIYQPPHQQMCKMLQKLEMRMVQDDPRGWVRGLGRFRRFLV